MENSAACDLFSLKWKGYGNHLTKEISNLLQDELLADVTLACDGNYIRAHKLLLSLCSPYFKKLFLVDSPEKSNTIVILNNVRFTDLENILQFVYAGHVNVSQSDLSSFLQTGELLQIEGLASCSDNADDTPGGSSLVPKDNSLNLPSTSRSISNLSSSSSDKDKDSGKRPASPDNMVSLQSPNIVAGARLPGKRLKSDDLLENSRQKSSSAGTLSEEKSQVGSDAGELPLIQIRSAANLLEIDPLQDNLMSYDGKPSDELEETEVNFGVLKAENIEVIDVDEKDEGSRLVQDMNQISEMLEESDSTASDHHDVFPSVHLTLPASSSQILDYGVSQTQGSRKVAERSHQLQSSSQSSHPDAKPPTSSHSSAENSKGIVLGTVKIEDDESVEEEDDVVIIGSTHISKTLKSSPEKRLEVPDMELIKIRTDCWKNLASNIPRLRCSVGQAVHSARMQGHGNQFNVEHVSCPICNCSVSKCALQNHMFTFHQDMGLESENREVCPSCGKYFKNKNSLKVHKSIYHRSTPGRPGSSRQTEYLYQNFPGMHFHSDYFNQ